MCHTWVPNGSHCSSRSQPTLVDTAFKIDHAAVMAQCSGRVMADCEGTVASPWPYRTAGILPSPRICAISRLRAWRDLYIYCYCHAALENVFSTGNQVLWRILAVFKAQAIFMASRHNKHHSLPASLRNCRRYSNCDSPSEHSTISAIAAERYGECAL